MGGESSEANKWDKITAIATAIAAAGIGFAVFNFRLNKQVYKPTKRLLRSVYKKLNLDSDLGSEIMVPIFRILF